MSLKVLYCNFCGKSSDEVPLMVAGTDCNICNECIELCNSVVDNHFGWAALEYASWLEFYRAEGAQR